MPFDLPVHLNIRQEIVVGLLALMVALGGFVTLAYHYLRKIEAKLHLVEIADDLSSNILELRRLEKNYFLYGHIEALEENRTISLLSLESVEKIFPDVKHLRAAKELDDLKSELKVYQGFIEKIGQHEHAGEVNEIQLLEDPLRKSGKALVDLSRMLVSFERKRILDIIHTLKAQLLTSFSIFLVFGGVLIPFVTKKIITPLRVIEKTTVRIAKGKFKTLPVRMSTPVRSRAGCSWKSDCY